MCKNAYYYRCMRRVSDKPGSATGKARCGGRRSLTKLIDFYVRRPKCPVCGEDSLQQDKYRQEHERGKNSRPCHCDGLPYPHRRGSKWCTHYAGEYDEIDMKFRPYARA